MSSVSIKSDLTDKLVKICCVTQKYLSTKDKINTDNTIIHEYTNRSIHKKFNTPCNPPLLLRQFNRNSTNNDTVDLLEASSNLDLEYHRNLIKCYFTLEEIRYMIDNMNDILVTGKNVWEKQNKFVSVYVVVNDETYELNYDGVFYLDHNYSGKRINITFENNTENIQCTKVYMDVDKI